MNHCNCNSPNCPFCHPGFVNPPFPHQLDGGITLTPMPMKGWECPRCTRIYGPSTVECFYCNNQVSNFYPTKVTIK